MRYLIIVLGLFLFAGCSKSDEETIDPKEEYFKKAILGSWSFDTVKVDGVTYIYEHTLNCERDYFQFYNREGKEFDFEETYVSNCSNCAPCATSTTNLRWELKGSTIKFYFGEQFIIEYKLIEVTETTFTYQVMLDFDNDGEKDLLEVSAIYYDPYNDFG